MIRDAARDLQLKEDVEEALRIEDVPSFTHAEGYNPRPPSRDAPWMIGNAWALPQPPTLGIADGGRAPTRQLSLESLPEGRTPPSRKSSSGMLKALPRSSTGMLKIEDSPKTLALSPPMALRTIEFSPQAYDAARGRLCPDPDSSAWNLSMFRPHGDQDGTAGWNLGQTAPGAVEDDEEYIS